jgi:peroxiredoxin
MSVHALPPDLPVPVDHGACDHLVGLTAPALVLESSQGPVDLAALGGERAVLYVYPRTGKPGVPVPAGWDAIPGARGCTPQSCGFRDHLTELAELGAHVAGLSAQPLDEQVEVAERLGLSYPVIADPDRRLGSALRLPTLEFDGAVLYRRVTLVLESGRIAKVFYPVFPPDRNAQEVIDWLRQRG